MHAALGRRLLVLLDCHGILLCTGSAGALRRWAWAPRCRRLGGSAPNKVGLATRKKPLIVAADPAGLSGREPVASARPAPRTALARPRRRRPHVAVRCT